LRIIDSKPTPGSNLYSVVCPNGHPFTTAGDSSGRVKCPKCKREGKLREMIKAWKATPAEKIARLKEISAEARELYSKWLGLPEPEKTNSEGKAMTAKLNEYYSEAKALMDEFKITVQP